MDEIEKTISAFEKYNDLEIEDYVTQAGREKCLDRNIKTDKYIGRDIFKANIEEWLSFFEVQDRSLYLDLLKRYRYYPEQTIKNVLYTLANKIKNDCLLQDFDDIYFITIASKKYCSSGGDILRAILRTELNLRVDNSLLDTSPNLTDICKKAKVIAFLDDVAGTGMTMYSHIMSLITKLNLTEDTDIKLYAVYICANTKKVDKKIKQIYKETNTTIIPVIYEKLEKELSRNKFDTDNAYMHALEIVSKYDQLIFDNRHDGDNEEECIRGFKDSQLLLSFCYNTPNNTIAAFWRPSRISSPLFLRDSCKKRRLDINDLKTRQEQTRRNCYMGKAKKR